MQETQGPARGKQRLTQAIQADAGDLVSSQGTITDDDDDDFNMAASVQDDIAADNDFLVPRPSILGLRNVSILGLRHNASVRLCTFVLLSGLICAVCALNPISKFSPHLEPWLSHLWYISRELVVWSLIGCTTSVMISYIPAKDFGGKVLWFAGLAIALAILILSVTSETNTADQPSGSWKTPVGDDHGQMEIASERQLCDARLSDLHDKWCWQSLPARTLHTDSGDKWLCERPVRRTPFAADLETYGIGTRGGLYMQWLATLMANNFLAGTGQGMQKVGLVFCALICWRTLQLSRLNLCVSSIEIEILHWLFWTSIICFFASAPSRLRLIIWKLDLIPLFLLLVSGFMAVNGIRFLWFTHEMVFQRMPCGSWHLWDFPVFDMSDAFGILRYGLMVLLVPAMVLLSIRFFAANSRPLTSLRILGRMRHRDGLLTLGLFSIILSMAAIELTLSWNNVANIYSLQTDVEYISLTVAILSLVNVCWGLGQQELPTATRGADNVSESKKLGDED
ncbi:hypothetical protein F5Y18DRAFT_248980 [Xylariaceae sp. FL1019]|nr:hypothetical protein F5Y18DRAFT_248980 [Xylariaceae sp. FL1019]